MKIKLLYFLLSTSVLLIGYVNLLIGASRQTFDSKNILRKSTSVIDTSKAYHITTQVLNISNGNDSIIDKRNITPKLNFAKSALLPFCDNFETVNNQWTVDSIGNIGSNWTYGIPTGNILDSAHSLLNVYGVGELGGLSGYLPSSTSLLVSPVFDFSAVTAANLSFWQNRQVEAGWDGVRLEFTTDGGLTWNTLGGGSTINPDPFGVNWYSDDLINSSSQPAWDGDSNGWIISKYKLGNVPGLCGSPVVQFRFVFTSDASVQQSGFHLDDFCITIPCTNDISIIGVNSPGSGSGQPTGDSTTINIQLENLGTTGQTNFNIGYSINDTVQPSITYTDTLIAGEIADAELPSIAVPANQYTVCIWTDLVADCDNSNDTICINYVGIPTLNLSPAFCDDFESGNSGWSTTVSSGGNPGTTWQLGNPSFGLTTGANSGMNAWDINLNSNYTNNAKCELYSPYFDFSTISAGYLNFTMNYNTEDNWDGARLEYSNDNGITWNMLGGGNLQNPDNCGRNWYTDSSLNSSQLPAWAGKSAGWTTATYKHCCTSGIFNHPTPVQFRFVFTSDASVTIDGFSIDDFCIYTVQGDDIGISTIIISDSNATVGSLINLAVILENYGSNPITSAPVNLSVNGQIQNSFNWTGILNPCSIDTIIFPGFTVLQDTSKICAWTSLNGDGSTSNDSTCFNLISQSVTGINYPQLNQPIIIYPNPTSVWISIKVNKDLIDSRYLITDMTGKKLESGYITNELTKLSIEAFSPGIYFITIGNTIKQTYKLVKE